MHLFERNTVSRKKGHYVFKALGELVKDLVMVGLAICSLVVPWRLCSFYRKVKEHRRELLDGRKPRTSLRWRLCASGGYYILTDYFIILQSLLLLITIVRAADTIRIIRDYVTAEWVDNADELRF
jgi:hypothetical protein